MFCKRWIGMMEISETILLGSGSERQRMKKILLLDSIQEVFPVDLRCAKYRTRIRYEATQPRQRCCASVMPGIQ